MSGPRYSIIPAEFFDDERLQMAHVKVMASLCRHTKRSGWCRLKQSSIAEEAGYARQTCNAALADLVEWGHVEKHKKEAGQSLAYRVVMDSREAPPADLPEEEIDPSVHKKRVSATGDKGDVASDATGVSSLSRQGCQLSPDNKNEYLTNNKRKTREGASEDSNFGSEVKRPLAALEVTSTDVSWRDWLRHLGQIGRSDLVDQATAAGRMTVAARWPKADTPLPSIPQVGLTERSRAMVGEGA